MASRFEKPVIAFLSEEADLQSLAKLYSDASPGLDVRFADNLGNLEEITAAVCWFPPMGLLRKLPNLQMIQSVGAGIEHIVRDRDLPDHVPLFRVIDNEMALGMAAYVTWAIVDHHRRFREFAVLQQEKVWDELQTSLPSKYIVGIAGFGTLGEACAKSLSSMGYSVRGWSRRPKDDSAPGVELFSGSGRVDSFLEGCNALVCLLPLTDETRGFLNYSTFERLADGAHVINVGRGEHLVEEDLASALAAGKIGRATLDTFSQEPLPKNSPLWTMGATLVTPHIATSTKFETIVSQTLENYTATVSGADRSNRQVDLKAGY